MNLDLLTAAEISTKLDYISRGVDELKEDKQRQWDRLDEHSNSISFLKAVAVTIAFVVPIVGGIVGYFLGQQ